MGMKGYLRCSAVTSEEKWKWEQVTKWREKKSEQNRTLPNLQLREKCDGPCPLLVLTLHDVRYISVTHKVYYVAHNVPPTHTMAPSTHTIAPPTHRIALLMTIQYLGIQLAHNRTHIIKRMHVNCYQTTVSGCSLSAMHSIIGYHPIAKWILQMQIWMNCCPFG